ncbi:MAG TPA: hypothetical protein VHO95_08045, partial [Candidatus Dormibacteraeota bacterium]|nr:hypothetical protein [Candidatus Dormibacteraeota bacterium]
GSIGDRPSEKWMDDLRTRGADLLSRASDRYSIGRFLAADAFFPFWRQALREPRPDEIAQAESSAKRAIEIAKELDSYELRSVALDAIGAFSSAVNDWPRARNTADERIRFEDKLGLYERLDAHSMRAWMSYLMGDLETADKDSAQMVARLLPGQAPFPALHLYAWRTVVLNALGRWDEAVSIFWRAVDAWHDAGSHSAGYAIRGFLSGYDIGKARGDSRLMGAATEPMESILSRLRIRHPLRTMIAPYMQGDAGLTARDPFIRFTAYPTEMAERRLNLAADTRAEVSVEVLEKYLARSARIHAPMLEAQVRRLRGLVLRDASELAAAIAIWEPRGALPSLGRARAERGLVRRDSAEMEDGLALLKKLGDVNYLDRFKAAI